MSISINAFCFFLSSIFLFGFSNFTLHQNHLGGLIKTQIAGQSVPDSVGLGWGQRMCISNKFCADAVERGLHFKNSGASTMCSVIGDSWYPYLLILNGILSLFHHKVCCLQGLLVYEGSLLKYNSIHLLKVYFEITDCWILSSPFSFWDKFFSFNLLRL